MVAHPPPCRQVRPLPRSLGDPSNTRRHPDPQPAPLRAELASPPSEQRSRGRVVEPLPASARSGGGGGSLTVSRAGRPDWDSKEEEKEEEEREEREDTRRRPQKQRRPRRLPARNERLRPKQKYITTRTASWVDASSSPPLHIRVSFLTDPGGRRRHVHGLTLSRRQRHCGRGT